MAALELPVLDDCVEEQAVNKPSVDTAANATNADFIFSPENALSYLLFGQVLWLV
jgi:hypothetical protein